MPQAPIGLIRDNEALFIDEISTYNIREALLHLHQLKSLVGFRERNREPSLRQIEQVGLTLEINIDDWKKEKMNSETTLQSIKTSTPSIIVNIENLKKVEQVGLALEINIDDWKKGK